MGSTMFRFLDTAMESFKMEGDSTVDIEIAIKVDEAVEEAVAEEEAIEEAADEVEEAAEIAEIVVESYSTLAHNLIVAKKYGMSRGMFAMMNKDDEMAYVCGQHVVPSLESFDIHSTNNEATQICIEAMSDRLKSAWETIVRMVKQVRDSIVKFFKELMDQNLRNQNELKKLQDTIKKSLPVDPAKIEKNETEMLSFKDIEAIAQDLSSNVKNSLANIDDAGVESLKVMTEKEYTAVTGLKAAGYTSIQDAAKAVDVSLAICQNVAKFQEFIKVVDKELKEVEKTSKKNVNDPVQVKEELDEFKERQQRITKATSYIKKIVKMGNFAVRQAIRSSNLILASVEKK